MNSLKKIVISSGLVVLLSVNLTANAVVYTGPIKSLQVDFVNNGIYTFTVCIQNNCLTSGQFSDHSNQLFDIAKMAMTGNKVVKISDNFNNNMLMSIFVTN